MRKFKLNPKKASASGRRTPRSVEIKELKFKVGKTALPITDSSGEPIIALNLRIQR